MINKIASNCNPIGMSYWRNINFHSYSDVLQVFLSIKDELHIFTVRKSDLALVDIKPLGIIHTGEGCYFSAIDPNRLFIPEGKTLNAYDIISKECKEIWKSNYNLWQCHSSIDENSHSATLRNNEYINVGWGVYKNNQEKQYGFKGEEDECQIDKSGRWLLIKENNYNRIINLDTEQEKIIQNEEGALGHSDCGYGFALGENDYSPFAGACDLIDFNTWEKRTIYSTGIWNMGYVSTQNDRILLSTPEELILVQPETKWKHGNQSEEYEHRVKANLCPLGEFACYSAFIDGSLNAYLLKL